ncbi:MAG TPA: EthD family reductase [Solirubrobacteraceae bacterium]|nr:EthD family reductase [Solirubrobacteraceae bacterium]
MIRVSVLYPNTDGNTLDHDYFLGTHMPLVADRCGDGLRKWEVDKGIAGGEADAPPAYMAVAHLTFDSVEAFNGAFGPHADEILGDIPNYTNATPVIQVSEVRH